MIKNDFSGATIGAVAQFDGCFGGKSKDETICAKLPSDFFERTEKLMRHAGMSRSQYLRAALILFEKLAPNPTIQYTPDKDLRFLVANDPDVVDALKERYSV